MDEQLFRSFCHALGIAPTLTLVIIPCKEVNTARAIRRDFSLSGPRIAYPVASIKIEVE